MNTVLDENFISSDAGNGWAACYRLVGGKLKSHGIPHARARVTGAKLATDLGGQNIAEYADFMGQRYGYGDGIWNLTDAPIDLHQNTARRYGGNMHLFLMLVNIACLNVKSGSDLTLIVPAPPGLLNEVAPQIKKSILAGESGKHDGIWHLQLRRDKKPREYRILRVIVVPEGAGPSPLTASTAAAIRSSCWTSPARTCWRGGWRCWIWAQAPATLIKSSTATSTPTPSPTPPTIGQG